MFESSQSNRSFALKAALVMAIMIPAAVQAQDEGSENILEEVLVTAQRREQNVQEIGVAVTAFSGEDVRELGIIQAKDLAQHTPSLSIAEGVSGNIPIFAIRGVGLDDYNLSNSSSVAIYVDDVFASSPAFLNYQLMDTRAVEIVRGPQGTLFGKNATGGAITFRSNTPEEAFEASILASYGRFSETKVEGFVNGGLSDSVRGRLAFSTLQGGDYQTDVYTGAKYGDYDKSAVRGMLEFDFSDTVTGLFKLHAGRDKSLPAQPVVLDDTGGLVAAGIEGGSYADGFHTARRVESGFVQKFDNSGWGASFILDAELSFADLRSITAYAEEDVLLRENYDGRARVYSDLPMDISMDQISQEFRLTSNSDGRVSWVGGVIWSEESQGGLNAIFLNETIDLLDVLFETGLGPVVESPSGVDPFFDQKVTSFGAYLHTETQLSDTWRLTAGLRYSDDEIDYRAEVYDLTAFNDGFGGYIAATHLFLNGIIEPSTAPIDGQGVYMGGVGGPGEDPGKHDDNNVSGKIALDWMPNEDLLLFGSIATGYKGGRFYSGPVPNSSYLFYVKPEELLAYELGFKSTLASGRFILNGTAFHYDYEDRQSFIVDVWNAVLLANIPESELRGVEFEFNWRLSDRLDIRGGLTWLDTEVIEPPTAEDLNGNQPLGTITRGSPLSQAPEWSYSLTGAYSWSMSEKLDGQFLLSYSYKDEQLASVSDPNSVYGPIKNLDARLTIAPLSADWQVSLWGKNLTDSDGTTFGQTTFPGETLRWVQKPRTYGVEFIYTWR